jgi:hypothetical protein
MLMTSLVDVPINQCASEEVVSVDTGFWEDWRNEGGERETVEVLVTLNGALGGTDGGTVNRR